MLLALCTSLPVIAGAWLHECVHKALGLSGNQMVCHRFVLQCADPDCQCSTSSIPCREDAIAAMQLYQLHVKDDPELMSYKELIEHELRNMRGIESSKM